MSALRNPWVQLVLGIICMASTANYQYGWTVFVDPLGHEHSWARAAIQVSFSVFVLTETWLVPFEAALADRFGPRIMVTVGGIFCGISWAAIDAHATSLSMLYLGGAFAGIGAGLVYGTCIGNALKWFAGRRGLAAGLTAAGFGAGAAITVAPLSLMIRTAGASHTFIVFGVIQGIIILVFAQGLQKAPPQPAGGGHYSPKVLIGKRDYAPLDTLRSPVFWVMYVMFVLVASGGLMAIAQLSPIASDRYISNFPVTIFWITAPAITYALSLNSIMNGVTRPLLGFLSDNFGREITLFWIFLAEGAGIYALLYFGWTPVAFVLLSGVVFFAWGEIYSIFPSTTRDHFGQKYATTNYGMLYTAKGTASLLVPLGSVVAAATGSWYYVLFIAGAFNIVAAIMAIAVLRPVRVRELRRDAERSVSVPGSAIPATP